MKPPITLLTCLIWLFLSQPEISGQSSEDIIFRTEGSSFSPLIQLKGAATVLWTFSDGTTSNELHPVKDYGAAATRINHLSVNPWNAVKMINIGYDAGDNGSWEIPWVADQHVSKVENIQLVKDNLEIWCSSYNNLDTLVFDNFISLNTIECFLSQSVKHISLENTPALTRLCLEDNNLSVFDISGSPSLMDIRGAVNNYPTILFSNSTEEVWHICVRDNPQITNDSLFTHMEMFPNIAELLIWNDNQHGKFSMSQNHPTRNISIMADGNHYSSLDLRGSLQNEAGYGEVSFAWNDLESVDINGCDQIRNISLNGNWMSSDTVDKILRQLDEFNTYNGYVNLTGNGAPTPAGMVHKENLDSRGWTVGISYLPEINVAGNGVSITDGDLTPSLTDSTDFGNVFIGDTIIREFIIQNTGNAILNGWGPPPHVFIYGADAAYFSIADSVHFPIAAQGADTLRITFTCDTKRSYSAEIYITNEDNDEAPFNFDIRATGAIDNAAVIAAYQDITDEILFLSEGSSFAPLIQLNSPASVVWTFADSTTSNSLNPFKEYRSAASRMNRLKVTPWSAMKMINIGFDGGDGGWWLPFVPDQHVSYLQNISLAKDSLKYWCSSYNLLDSLILDNFVNLEAAECFLSHTVTNVSLKNTPKLRRLCLEDNDLGTFDISESPALEDIRGALNNYSTISFSDSTDAFWHICVRDNPQVTNDSLFAHMEAFPNIAELFIWNMNQGGKFSMSQNHPTQNISILADGNHYSSLDLRGSLQNENGYAEVYFTGNQIHSVDLTGCDQIRRLGLAWNMMPSDTVDKVLQQLNAFGTSNGTVYLGGNETPGPVGMACKENLESRGWYVEVSGAAISILGNWSIIYNGDNTPEEDNNTDFGATRSGVPVTHEFVIRNDGSSQLYLTGIPPVSISGTGAGDFQVSLQPTSPIDPWWNSTSMQITFNPNSPGLHEATVTIPHDGVNTLNPYTFSISGSGDTQISDTIIHSGNGGCFDSESILTVAGDGSSVIFENGSVVNLIAVKSIYLLPGYASLHGSHTHAWISPDSTLCPGDAPAYAVTPKEKALITGNNPEDDEPMIKLFPNPGNGVFTLQVMNGDGSAEVTIHTMLGEKIYSTWLTGNAESAIHLPDLEQGCYFIHIRTGKGFITRKLIVER